MSKKRSSKKGSTTGSDSAPRGAEKCAASGDNIAALAPPPPPADLAETPMDSGATESSPQFAAQAETAIEPSVNEAASEPAATGETDDGQSAPLPTMQIEPAQALAAPDKMALPQAAEPNPNQISKWTKPVDYFSTSAKATYSNLPAQEPPPAQPYSGPVDYLSASAVHADQRTARMWHDRCAEDKIEPDDLPDWRTAILGSPGQPVTEPVQAPSKEPAQAPASAPAHLSEPAQAPVSEPVLAPEQGDKTPQQFVNFEEAAVQFLLAQGLHPGESAPLPGAEPADSEPKLSQALPVDLSTTAAAVEASLAAQTPPQTSAGSPADVGEIPHIGVPTGGSDVQELKKRGDPLELDKGAQPRAEAPKKENDEKGWQPAGVPVDPKSLPAAPVSERSAKFIEALRQSIMNAGTTELTQSREIDQTQAQLSGEWLPVHSMDNEDEENRVPPPRPATPARPPKAPTATDGDQPAPPSKKKKKTVEPSISLQDRLAGENIEASDLTEDQIAIQRLKDRTTAGHYPIYLAVFLLVLLAGFGFERFAGPDATQISQDAGRAIFAAVNRVMVPNFNSTLAYGLKLYEDEEARGIAAKRVPLEAAVRVASGQASFSGITKKKAWYQSLSGLLFGLPAATLFALRQVYQGVSAQSSMFELLMIAMTYLSMILLGLIMYMKTRHRLAVLFGFMTPLLFVFFTMLASVVFWAMLSTCSAVLHTIMPQTATCFTAAAINGVTLVMVYNSFFARKKSRHPDPRLA